MKWNYDTGADANATVYDEKGNALQLGEENSLSCGGQGRVYEFPGNHEIVVKVYSDETLSDARKVNAHDARLDAMLRNPACANNRSLAWPVLKCYDKEGRIKGYAMMRVQGYVPFKSLFGGKARVLQKFPSWTRRDIAETVRSFLHTVMDLERSHVVVCDWNADNFMVNANHEVMFIDTDSYEIHERGGIKHLSAMYFAENAAPEILRDKSLLKRPRTIAQSRFSAAVVAYQLLMCGAHPYSFAGEARDGTFVGTPEQNIIVGKCPLGRGTDCQLNEMTYNLWSWMTGRLHNAFVTTFRDGHGNPGKRIPIEELDAAVAQFIREMGREPMRLELAPDKPKDGDWKQAHPRQVVQYFGGCPGFGQRPKSGFRPRMPRSMPPNYGAAYGYRRAQYGQNQMNNY